MAMLMREARRLTMRMRRGRTAMMHLRYVARAGTPLEKPCMTAIYLQMTHCIRAHLYQISREEGLILRLALCGRHVRVHRANGQAHPRHDLCVRRRLRYVQLYNHACLIFT